MIVARMRWRNSTAENWQEETRNVFLLSLEDDGAVFSGLNFLAHQLEELVERDQVGVEGLTLERRSDAASATSPTTERGVVVRVFCEATVHPYHVVLLFRLAPRLCLY